MTNSPVLQSVVDNNDHKGAFKSDIMLEGGGRGFEKWEKYVKVLYLSGKNMRMERREYISCQK